jgi:hypothetical protein
MLPPLNFGLYAFFAQSALNEHTIKRQYLPVSCLITETIEWISMKFRIRVNNKSLAMVAVAAINLDFT